MVTTTSMPPLGPHQLHPHHAHPHPHPHSLPHQQNVVTTPSAAPTPTSIHSPLREDLSSNLDNGERRDQQTTTPTSPISPPASISPHPHERKHLPNSVIDDPYAPAPSPSTLANLLMSRGESNQSALSNGSGGVSIGTAGTESSEDSSLSRNSSARSTESVQAVPFRTPMMSKAPSSPWPYGTPNVQTPSSGHSYSSVYFPRSPDPPHAGQVLPTPALPENPPESPGIPPEVSNHLGDRASISTVSPGESMNRGGAASPTSAAVNSELALRLSSGAVLTISPGARLPSDFGGDSGTSSRRSSGGGTTIGGQGPPLIFTPSFSELRAGMQSNGSNQHLQHTSTSGSVVSVGSSVGGPPSASGSTAHLGAVDSLKAIRPQLLGKRTSSSQSIGVVVRKSKNDFEMNTILGEGSYSTVYLGKDRHSPFRSYAIKVIDKAHIKKENKIKYAMIERDSLNQLERHPGVVRLYWTFQDDRSLYFVLELAEHGEILKYIKKFGSFQETCARFYAAQILSAIEHMHTRNIIHRDLKPENILLDKDMRIKIADFGTAKILKGVPEDDRANSFVGTAEYVSPEVLTTRSKGAFKSSDLWALGCIIYQFIAGRPPFKAPNEYLTFQKITNLEYSFPDDFPEHAKDIVQKLLVIDPSQRLGADPTTGFNDLKSHPFFAPIDFSTIWTMDPPRLVTGINQPAPRPPVIQYDIEEEESDEAIDDADSDFGGAGYEEAQSGVSDPSGPRRSNSSSRVNGVMDRLRGTLPVRPISRQDTSPPASEGSKWSDLLLPRELILYTAPVVDRTPLFSRKRHLILTDYPRLLTVKEGKTKVDVKGEVLVASIPTMAANESAGTGNGNGKAKESSLELLQSVEQDGPKGFIVKTSSKAYRYEDPSCPGTQPTRWISAIREAQDNARGRPSDNDSNRDPG